MHYKGHNITVNVMPQADGTFNGSYCIVSDNYAFNERDTLAATACATAQQAEEQATAKAIRRVDDLRA